MMEEEEKEQDLRKKNNTEFLEAIDEFLAFNREFVPDNPIIEIKEFSFQTIAKVFNLILKICI